MLYLSLQASAAIISVNDWSLVDSFDNDVGSPLFRVTETFTPASENGGTNNRYAYEIENLTTDLRATLLRFGQVSNLWENQYSGLRLLPIHPNRR